MFGLFNKKEEVIEVEEGKAPHKLVRAIMDSLRDDIDNWKVEVVSRASSRVWDLRYPSKDTIIYINQHYKRSGNENDIWSGTITINEETFDIGIVYMLRIVDQLGDIGRGESKARQEALDLWVKGE